MGQGIYWYLEYLMSHPEWVVLPLVGIAFLIGILYIFRAAARTNPGVVRNPLSIAAVFIGIPLAAWILIQSTTFFWAPIILGFAVSGQTALFNAVLAILSLVLVSFMGVTTRRALGLPYSYFVGIGVAAVIAVAASFILESVLQRVLLQVTSAGASSWEQDFSCEEIRGLDGYEDCLAAKGE